MLPRLSRAVHHPQPPWGRAPMGGPWGAHAVFLACCAVNIPIYYWQHLEGFEPILKTNTQYQFFESFKTILWLVLNSNRPVD
jgi:hypothetical protein